MAFYLEFHLNIVSISITLQHIKPKDDTIKLKAKIKKQWIIPNQEFT